MKKTKRIRRKQIAPGVASGVDNWEKDAQFLHFETDDKGRRFAVYAVKRWSVR